LSTLTRSFIILENMSPEQISPAPPVPPQRPYRWGKIWAWFNILLGVGAEIFALVELIRSGREILGAPWEGFLVMIFLGIYFIIMGRGLLRKGTYGLVMFVIIGVLILVNTVIFWLDPAMSRSRRWSELGVAVPLTVCLYYYLRRFREFH
jgi:hypothetical protein